MDRKDMDIASNAWGNFFSTEEGKKWKKEMFSHPTKEEVENVRKASEELGKYSIYDANDNKTLHLTLKRKWWDMIASGEKKEEYRSQSDYWIKRLIEGQYYGSDALDKYKPYKNVCFHLGYTNVTMMFRIVCIHQGYGNPEWGGGKERVFVISLGERIR